MTQLAEAHIVAQQRLRELTATGVQRAWQQLPGYDQANVDQFLSQVVPLVLAAQRQSVLLTEAFLARELGRLPLGIAFSSLVGAALRAGVTPEEVYRRPFVTVWTALGNDRPRTEAIATGAERAVSTAVTDVQLAMRATLRDVGAADRYILGYQRVPDGDACAFCRLVAGQRYTTDQLMPVHNRCVAGDTIVWASAPPPRGGTETTDLGGAHAATRRWYSGEVVALQTAAGYQLTVTPNHPVLTDRGWIAAGLLREGDSVISSTRADGVIGGIPDEQHMPARIEQCFRARPVSGLVAVPFAAENFHGDIGDGQVDVVFPNGDLDARVLAALSQPREHERLAGGFGQPLRFARPCLAHQALVGLRSATLRGVRCDDAGATLPRGLARRAGDVLLGRTTQRDVADEQVAPDRAAIDAKATRQLEHRLAGHVQLDRVRHTRRIDWSGHVFNLVTAQGWYTANAIVTHNCGCGVDVITENNRGDFTGNTDNDLDVTRDGLTAAVEQHGELGPVLVNGAHHFTAL